MNNVDRIDELHKTRQLSKPDWTVLINSFTESDRQYAAAVARRITDKIYGKDIYLRGLIEISNYCKNNCYYCGIRRGNKNAARYRLLKNDILSCAKTGSLLGYRTFVLQGGEDMFYTDDVMCDIISALKKNYPDCAVTLSVGEKSKTTYKRYFDAGADRYLLRHETANAEHYSRLHPCGLSLENRKKCLFNLKQIGFQVGSGFMVGSPYQSPEHLALDMMFLNRLSPHMVGIGPFIPHRDTRFAQNPAGSVRLTLMLISLIRIMLPHALIPATTALGTLDKTGREKGFAAGANVVMPNLSPESVRCKYQLYDNKICIGDESAQQYESIKKRIESAGYTVSTSRGDFKGD